MPITIDGSGTITGLSAGGLPDGSVTTAEIADAAVTAAKMSGAQSGSAPIYGARAWVNFNGTGTVAIRASGNVSSITDNGTADYTVNFTNAMPDANYAAVADMGDATAYEGRRGYYRTVSTTAFRFKEGAYDTTSTLRDVEQVHVAIFR
jgi:hypothetical protein